MFSRDFPKKMELPLQLVQANLAAGPLAPTNMGLEFSVKLADLSETVRLMTEIPS